MVLFSIHNAFRKKAVAFLAVMGVAFGCALMTFLFSVAAGMERRVEATFSEMSGRVMVSGRYAVFGGVLQGVGSSNIPASYMDLILADEPTGNLDSASGAEIARLLMELNCQGKTVIVATHDSRLAEACGRVVGLADGKVVSDRWKNGG